MSREDMESEATSIQLKIVRHYGEATTMEKQPWVYILTNKRNGTLYVGVTSDLPKRIWEHKNKVVKGFTQKYEELNWLDTGMRQ